MSYMRINQRLKETDFLVVITHETIAVNTLIRFDEEIIAYFSLPQTSPLIEESPLTQYIKKTKIK